MSYVISSSDNYTVQINLVNIMDEEGRIVYTRHAVDCEEDFDAVVSCLKLNYCNPMYKNGAALIEMLTYRLNAGYSDLTQDLGSGMKIIFA